MNGGGILSEIGQITLTNLSTLKLNCDFTSLRTVSVCFSVTFCALYTSRYMIHYWQMFTISQVAVDWLVLELMQHIIR